MRESLNGDGRGRGGERFDGSFRKDQTGQNKWNYMYVIRPTYGPHISAFYTLFNIHIHKNTHTFTLVNTQSCPHPAPQPLYPHETMAHPSAHCPAVSLCLWTIPTCRVRGPNGPLLFSSRLNINITTIQRLQRISSYNRDTQIKVPRQ